MNEHEMSAEKRQKIYDDLNYHDAIVARELEQKRIEEQQKILRKRKMSVYSIKQLRDKYEDYSIVINEKIKKAILHKPLEVKYLPIFRRECAILGLACEIRGDYVKKLYK